MRLVRYGLCLVAVLATASRARAQTKPLPSIELSAAPDVPPGLVVRVRGELAAAGITLGSALATQKQERDPISIVLRQTSTEITAEVKATGKDGMARTHSVSVPASSPQDFAPDAFSELAVRATELLRTQIAWTTFDQPSVPGGSRLATVATKAVKPTLHPWLLWAGPGVVFGAVQNQAQATAHISAAYLQQSGLLLGANFVLPVSSATPSAMQGTWATTSYMAAIDLGVSRKLSSRWRWWVFASAGAAVTRVVGRGTDPFVSNTDHLISFMGAAGARLSLAVSSRVFLNFQTQLVSLLPRAGVRVVQKTVAAADWVMPVASLGAGFSW